jgi:hypothetical protein
MCNQDICIYTYTRIDDSFDCSNNATLFDSRCGSSITTSEVRCSSQHMPWQVYTWGSNMCKIWWYGIHVYWLLLYHVGESANRKREICTLDIINWQYNIFWGMHTYIRRYEHASTHWEALPAVARQATSSARPPRLMARAQVSTCTCSDQQNHQRNFKHGWTYIRDNWSKSSKMAHFVFKCNKEDYLSLIIGHFTSDINECTVTPTICSAKTNSACINTWVPVCVYSLMCVCIYIYIYCNKPNDACMCIYYKYLKTLCCYWTAIRNHFILFTFTLATSD